jgi:hypothetical protein
MVSREQALCKVRAALAIFAEEGSLAQFYIVIKAKASSKYPEPAGWLYQFGNHYPYSPSGGAG